MAVYQFFLAVVPTSGLLKEYGEIPECIEVVKSQEKEGFEHNTEVFWALAQVQAKDISKEMDGMIDRASWGNDEGTCNWKIATTTLDIDAWLAFHVASGCIEEFTFRVDLRDNELTFLRQMITLAKHNDYCLMNDEGQLVEPGIEKVWAMIKQSKAYLFLTDQTQFWASIKEE